MRWLLPLLLALGSCAPFHFERQRIFLRHDAEADTLDLLLVFENVSAVKSDPRVLTKAEQESLTAIRQVAWGGRRFLFLDWPFDLDLDGLARKAAAGEWPRPPGDDLARRLLARALDIQVRAARLIEDPAGQVGLVQRVRVAHASEVLVLLNEMVTWATQDDDWGGSGGPARRAWAAAGGTWVAFQPDGSLAVACPVSPEEAAAFARAGLDPELDALVQLLGGLSRLEIEDHVLHLAFDPRPDGWIAFDVRFGQRELSPTVAQTLIAEDEVAPGPLESVIAELLADG
jgi:hypothetical protein